MRQIPLTQNQVALVDDNLFDYLNQFKWSAKKHRNTFYAIRGWKTPQGKWTNQLMHHLVIGVLRLPAVLKLSTDHNDGNGLNNQRLNLKILSNRDNQLNRICHREGKLSGAILKKDHGRVKRWMARIRIGKKTKNLGYFATEQEAHQAYLKALKELV